EHHAERNMERLEHEPSEIITELLHPRLMADRRMWVGSAGGWIRGIFRPAAVDLVEMLGLRIIGFQVFVRDRPRGRETAPVLDLAEVLPAKAEERGAVELGVAAHPVVGVGMKLPTFSVAPHFFRAFFPHQVGPLPYSICPPHGPNSRPALPGNPVSRMGQAMRQRATTCSGPDDDHIEVFSRRHNVLRETTVTEA